MTRYHSGEIAVQEQAGSTQRAQELRQSIRGGLPPQAEIFLKQQPFMIVGHADDVGQVWASLVMGAPGFMAVVANDRVQIKALPNIHDPLLASLATPRAVGSLVIDFTQRRRLRINGRAQQLSAVADTWEIEISECYNNCPKYIQRRSWQLGIATGDNLSDCYAGQLSVGEQLTAVQAQWIAQSDTFFIASIYETADVSHRGGQPGFVAVRSLRQLCWPDYAGNGMFQTLGNVTNNPATGLLWLDFHTGTILQLTGHAHIDWERAAAAPWPGAERVIVWNIQQVRQITPLAVPLQWQFGQYSPFNPAVGSID